MTGKTAASPFVSILKARTRATVAADLSLKLVMELPTFML